MATYAELVKQIDELKAKAEAQRMTEQAAVIAEIKEKIETYNLTAKDLGLDRKFFQNVNGNTRGRKSASPVSAKYRHPVDQQLVWSGRGRQPRWITAWVSEGEGRKLENLLIK